MFHIVCCYTQKWLVRVCILQEYSLCRWSETT